jgi:hypothetical protein
MTDEKIRVLIDNAFADVEADIFHALKANRTDRAQLLSLLDVLTKAKERIDARLER